jgi:hypothetical protein
MFTRMCLSVTFICTLPVLFAVYVPTNVNQVHPRKTWYPDQKFHWLLILETIFNTSFQLPSEEENSYCMAVALKVLFPCELRFLAHSLLKIQQAQGLNDMLPYFSSVKTCTYSFAQTVAVITCSSCQLRCIYEPRQYVPKLEDRLNYFPFIFFLWLNSPIWA